jgi:hypothetical protein
MKVCIWSSSFQADTLALALALDQDPAVDLLVVTKNKSSIVSEPILRFRPLNCVILDRDTDNYETAVKKFSPDIVFADNHLPPFEVSGKLLYHWHGLPLKIRPAKDLRAFHRHVGRLIGSVKKPNRRFLAQCYGRVDFDHRVNVWGLPADNCRIWGSAFSDLLLAPPYQKADLEDYFHLDLVGRKTVLLSVTWHFGDKVFGVLGDDDEILSNLVNVANEREANIIFSLHDKHRYNPTLLEKIEKHAARCQRSFIKYKSENADNLADLIASDVMICSFSSFIVFHYFTGKPSIHILPVDRSKPFVNMPTIKRQRIRSLWRRNSSNLWMYPFSENGGVVPESGSALIEDLQTALSDPSYGRKNADRFIQERICLPDGNTCQRIISDLKEWTSS